MGQATAALAYRSIVHGVGAELPLPPELEGAVGKAEGLGKGFQPLSKEQARRMVRLQ